MTANEISFNNLPKAIAFLVSEVAEIKSLVERGQFCFNFLESVLSLRKTFCE
jgi:hypothetical protein